MTSILTSDSVPPLLITQLREWFESEWGDVDPFEGNHPDVVVPSPIVAVNGKTALMGGLAFSSFPSPEGSGIAVWINALLISPDERKKGIASALVQAAEAQAKRLAIHELFVLSEYPELYQKLGWQIAGMDDSQNETILTKNLASA